MSIAPPRPTKISDEPIEPDTETSSLTEFLFGNKVITTGTNKFTIWVKGYKSVKPGDGLYKHLIEAHVKEHSEELLIKAIQGEMQTLPLNIQEEMDSHPEFSKKTINSYGTKKDFWIKSSSREAFYEFMNVACDILSLPEELKELISKKFIIRRYQIFGYYHRDLLEDEIKLHNMAFSIFQIITLRFAMLGIRGPDLRKFWGIKKGIFS